MKRICDYTKAQDGALGAALILIVAGCGIALLHAFGGAGNAIGPIAPLFVPLFAPL